MSNDPILRMLGLAKKAGRLEIGEEPVGAACRARQARLVLLASDAAPNTLRRAAHFGQAGEVLWLETPFSKAEMGLCLGRSSCAMAALTDAGFAASLVEKLAARDPARYQNAAQQLRVKADRVLQRQKEQRQHEKNLRQGRSHPWAPPPKKEEAPPPQRGKPRQPKAHRRPDPKAEPERRTPGGRRLTGKLRHS
ncbi:50S ribosomal protein L7 [Pseudoflavonifractor sp. 60]|uniref:L7Ae/L30e/S12e/Gadd45 family ribosomal protein n=1 Tax=Pseudoflavonifractor sp. 60 TaxID=2304576 RepID=UPI001369067B|nr:ribosomal L7Ae/L30e/S12e/Gadd45 family protein [Pseudoflavonifractor sp. 60]NBI65554.1 50S ribosomal protein L7 [Pseudoflavonifractor sp. 60]